MKKIHIIFAAIAALSAAVSCQKAEIPSDSPVVDGKLTFSCSAEELKADIAEDGCPIWNVGDKIFVYNGEKGTIAGGVTKDIIYPKESAEPLVFYGESSFTNPITNAADIVERVVLTQDMISADGKTASVTVSIKPAASTYFAIAEDKGSKQIYAFAYNGKITTAQFHQHRVDGNVASSNAVRLAVASCPKTSTELFFKNVLSQLKFTVNDGTAYNKIVFSANTGSANTFACGISNVFMQGNDWGTAQNKTGTAAVHNLTIGNKATGALYVPLYFKANLDKGITIDFYAKSTDTTPTKTITINKPFRIERNQIIDLGNLDKLTPATKVSYYDNWEAGKDVIINGVAFNKTNFNKPVYHITADTEINTSTELKSLDGIYFVDKDVNLTTGLAASYTDVIILCNEPNAKANLEIRKLEAGGCPFRPTANGANLRIKGMNINLSGFYLQYVSGKTLGTTGIYECTINSATTRVFYSNDNSVTKNTEIIDSDLKLTTGDFILYEGTQNMNFDSVIIKNCQIWSSKGVSKKFQLFYNPATVSATVGKIVFDNNTCYDLTFSSAKGMFCPTKVDEFYCRNNIWSYSSENTSYYRILYLANDDGASHPSTEFPNYPDKAEILNNVKFNTDRVFAVFKDSERFYNKSWYPTYYKEFTKAANNPFTAVDVNTGVFTKASGYELMGAVR